MSSYRKPITGAITTVSGMALATGIPTNGMALATDSATQHFPAKNPRLAPCGSQSVRQMKNRWLAPFRSVRHAVCERKALATGTPTFGKALATGIACKTLHCVTGG